MQWKLTPFHQNIDSSVLVSAQRSVDRLTLSYRVTPIEGIALSASDQLRGRALNLWRDTCFELFIAQTRGAKPYLEWNFAPDGRYEVFLFDDIRELSEMSASMKDKLAPVQFSSQVCCNFYHLEVSLPLIAIHDILGHPEWRVQPTVVLKIKGELHYYAPQHTSATPNFHAFDHLSLVDPYDWVGEEL